MCIRDRFGALMVTSTGTFVSCNDYDDDIDRLDQEISNVKDAIKALEDKVGSGKYLSLIHISRP